MLNYKSATLPNRKYGGRVAQKKAIFESLATDTLSSTVSTSSIEFSRSPSFGASSDFSDRKTPFSYTSSGYKTLIDRSTQTEGDRGMDKNKSSELYRLTGDGRLDLMDILLEFTKVVKEMKSTSSESSSEASIAPDKQRKSPEHDNLRSKTRKFFSEKSSLVRPSLFNKNPSPKPFGGPAGYLQASDTNLRRMSYNEYRDLLEQYANDRKWANGMKRS